MLICFDFLAILNLIMQLLFFLKLARGVINSIIEKKNDRDGLRACNIFRLKSSMQIIHPILPCAMNLYSWLLRMVMMASVYPAAAAGGADALNKYGHTFR